MIWSVNIYDWSSCYTEKDVAQEVKFKLQEEMRKQDRNETIQYFYSGI